MRYLALVMLLALALAGSDSPPPPSGAAALAEKIAGCEQITSTPDVLAQQEVSCTSLWLS